MVSFYYVPPLSAPTLYIAKIARASNISPLPYIDWIKKKNPPIPFKFVQ